VNISDPIRYFARIQPEARAVIRDNGVGVSFARLDRLIDATATVLPEFGIRAGTVAGLAIAGADQFPGLVTALALARLGAVSADMGLGAAHMNLRIAEPGGPPGPDVPRIDNAEIWMRAQHAAASAAPVPSHQDGAAPCRIFASSGTTGSAKFMPVSHDQAMARALSVLLTPDGAGESRMCLAGLGVVFGYTMALCTLAGGGALVLSTNLSHALAAIRSGQVARLVLAPVVLGKLLEMTPPDARPAPGLRAVEFAGSTLPEPVRLLTEQRLCPNLISLFGSSEAGTVAVAPLAALGGEPLAVGFVVPGVEVAAVDDQGRPLPAGQEGVLRVRSHMVAAGYIGSGGAADAFRDGWFYSGDIGTVSADGMVRLVGRVGEVINAGGEKVIPQVVEDVLLSVPQVTDAAAFGVPDAAGVVQIWAAIAAPRPLPADALTALCREKLRSRAPKVILQFPQLPRNANGKLRREELVKAAIATGRSG